MDGSGSPEDVDGAKMLKGLAYSRCVPLLEAEADRREGDTRTALRVLARALEVPTRLIAKNSDVDDGVVVDRMRSGTGSFGFDAAKGEYVDPLVAGIIDPAKVVRVAMENAVSVASTLLLMEATMTDAPDPQAAAKSPPMDHAMLE